MTAYLRDDDGDITLGAWKLALLADEGAVRPLSPEVSFLSKLIRQMCESPAAAALLREAVQAGWRVGLSELGVPDFHLDVPERMIVLNNRGMNAAALGRVPHMANGVMLALVRALRDVWQEKRHGGFETRFAPESVLMLERVRTADMDVIAVLSAWELHVAGKSGLWRHILASDLMDVAQVFFTTLERAALSYPLHKALSASFDQWYRSTARTKACDHETLDAIDAVLTEDGSTGIGRAKAAALDIEVLSCLPDRTAYLMGRGNEILHDPAYAGMQDGTNQTHLTQILHDAQAVIVEGVAFRDPKLAAMIFPVS